MIFSYFLLASALGTFLQPWISQKLGMRNLLLFTAGMNTIGSLMRSGLGGSLETTSWGLVVAGTFVIGFACSLIQCQISEFTTAWFPSKEQTFVTSLIMSFENTGLGLAFIVPGFFMRSPQGLSTLLYTASVLSFIAVSLIAICFRAAPASPPSWTQQSKIQRRRMEDVQQRPSLFRYWMESIQLFRVRGFLHLVIAFVMSAFVQFTVSSYISETIAEDFEGDSRTVRRTRCP